MLARARTRPYRPLSVTRFFPGLVHPMAFQGKHAHTLSAMRSVLLGMGRHRPCLDHTLVTLPASLFAVRVCIGDFCLGEERFQSALHRGAGGPMAASDLPGSVTLHGNMS